VSIGGKQQHRTCSRSLVRAGLAGGGLQLRVVHRLDLSLELLHYGREGVWIHPVLAQPDADAQGGRIEIRVQQLGDLVQSLERLTSGVHLVTHRLRHAGSLPVLSKNKQNVLASQQAFP